MHSRVLCRLVHFNMYVGFFIMNVDHPYLMTSYLIFSMIQCNICSYDLARKFI